MRNSIRQFTSEEGPGQLIAFIAFGALIALLILTIPAKFSLLMLAGIFVLALISSRPEIGVLIILVLTSSIVFEDSLPLIPIGIGSFHISDVLLLFMVGTLGYKYLFNNTFTFAKSPLNTPLLFFFAISLVSAVISVVTFGVDFNDVARLVRAISYYLIFFLVTNLITEMPQIRFLLKGLIVIAGIVAAAMVVQAIIGESIQLMPGRIESAGSFGREFGTLRILPPGQTLIFVIFITTICFHVFAQDRPILFSGTFCLTLLLCAGTILTYNRSYWIAIILGVMVLLAITATEIRLRLLALLTVILIFGGSVLALFSGTEGKFGTTVDAVSHRFSSLFEGKELSRSGPVDDRLIENKYAIAQFRGHPLLGIGLGNEYRPQIYGEGDKLTYYIHNAYLWILTDTGIFGFIFYFWFYLRFLIRASRNWKKTADPFLKSALVGFMISGIAILPMALVIPIFMEWFSIVVLAICVGLSENIVRLYTYTADPESLAR